MRFITLTEIDTFQFEFKWGPTKTVLESLICKAEELNKKVSLRGRKHTHWGELLNLKLGPVILGQL